MAPGRELGGIRRVVVKVGSGLITTRSVGVDPKRLDALASDIAAARRDREIVLVTSGAIVTGMARLGLAERPRTIPEKQAAAAVGQSALMWHYEAAFKRHAVVVGQVLLTAHDIHLGRAFALALLIEALIEEGDIEAADVALRTSGLADEIQPGMAVNDLLEARGLLRIAQGKTRQGLDDLIEFGRRDELWGGGNPLASRWRSRASLAVATLGDGDAALQMALDDLGRARRWGAASGIGVALRAVALVEGGSASIGRLLEAAEVLERSPARLEQARVLTDLGAALRRANRRSEARDPLHKGLDLARRCCAHALVERASTELRAAGGRSSRPGTGGVQELTASERRVAELAADGQSNPEIAQALFVTRKTVETHLGHVYRKLGISGRADLRRALG